MNFKQILVSIAVITATVNVVTSEGQQVQRDELLPEEEADSVGAQTRDNWRELQQLSSYQRLRRHAAAYGSRQKRQAAAGNTGQCQYVWSKLGNRYGWAYTCNNGQAKTPTTYTYSYHQGQKPGSWKYNYTYSYGPQQGTPSTYNNNSYGSTQRTPITYNYSYGPQQRTPSTYNKNSYGPQPRTPLTYNYNYQSGQSGANGYSNSGKHHRGTGRRGHRNGRRRNRNGRRGNRSGRRRYQ